MTESSILTLDYIVERDNVTDRFRRNFLIKKAAQGALLEVGGISALALSAYKMITDWEFSWLLTGAGVVSAGAAIAGHEIFEKAYKTSDEFRKETGRFCEIPEYSYIGGKISRCETPVERNYGIPVDFINSLDELKYDPKNHERSKFLKLVDNVTVKSIKFEKFKEFTGMQPDEFGGEQPNFEYFESCKFVLERGSETMECLFTDKNNVPNVYRKMKKIKDKAAILARGLENGELLVERIYHPHPLLFKPQPSASEPIYRI